MARKLPWLVNKEEPVKKPRARPASHQDEKTPIPEPEDEEQTASRRGRGRASKPSASRSSIARTPPSSPIREPPPLTLMREGYDRDDSFIMVEDEFRAVAETYTQHLHKAEYRRLVHEARQAPKKALPEPASPMSKETKHRLKADALAQRQKESLRRVTGRKADDKEDSDEELVDLWSGTSLAPLMINTSQQKTSLVGLEGIASSSKAGRGVPRRNAQKILGSGGDNGRLDLTAKPEQPVAQKNLDPNPKSRVPENVVPRRQDVGELASTSRAVESVPLPRSRPVQKPASERPPAKRKFFTDFHDGFDEPEPSDKSTTSIRKTRATPLENSILTKRDSDRGEKKRSRLDEVPLFIL